MDKLNPIKIRYGYFITLKMLCKWIKNNSIVFVFTIFAGTILTIIFGDSLKLDTNPLLFFARSVLDSIIFIGIISYSYIKYSDTKFHLNIKSTFKLIFISFLFLAYSAIISMRLEIEDIHRPFLAMGAQFFGIVIAALCIIDIIKNNNPLGIVFAFSEIIDNIIFFIKNHVFLIIFQISTIMILGIVFSASPFEIRIRILLSLGAIVRILLAYIIIVFISEKQKDKNIYNENTYYA